MASEGIAKAVLGYFLEIAPEYSQGRCGLSLVPKLMPDKIRNTNSKRFNPMFLLIPSDSKLFPRNHMLSSLTLSRDYTH